MAYSITKHAKERYAQRIMDRDSKTDVAVFISQHEEKIQQDIDKMIEYGEELYEGTTNNVTNGNINVKVILNGHFVLILDTKKNAVVTLFEIDLGLGKEFNDEYIKKLREKLDNAQEEYKQAADEINEKTISYMETIEENNSRIDEYKKTIKILERENGNLQELINDMDVNKRIADEKVREIIGVFIGKKVL